MYLILVPSKRMISQEITEVHDCIFTSDPHRASGALKEEGVIVYSLENLKQIQDITITYQEVTKETA